MVNQAEHRGANIFRIALWSVERYLVRALPVRISVIPGGWVAKYNLSRLTRRSVNVQSTLCRI